MKWCQSMPPSDEAKELHPFWPEPLSHVQLKDLRSMLDIVIALRTSRVDGTIPAEIFFDDDGTTLVLSAPRPIEHSTEAAE